MYDPAIARFTGVDPISDQFAWVSTYNYAENEPIANIDLHGLQRLHYGAASAYSGEGAKFQKKNPGVTRAIGETVVGFTPAGVVLDVKDFGQAAANGDGVGMVLAGAGFVPGIGDAVKILGKRIRALVSALDNKRITVGAGMNLETGEIFISTSEKGPRSDMLDAMNPDEKFIRGDGHAETTLSNSGEKIDVVSASKPVWIECEIDLRGKDIHVGSTLLNDFSRKRKQDLSDSEQQILRETVQRLRNNN